MQEEHRSILEATKAEMKADYDKLLNEFIESMEGAES